MGAALAGRAGLRGGLKPCASWEAQARREAAESSAQRIEFAVFLPRGGALAKLTRGRAHLGRCCGHWARKELAELMKLR